MALGGDGPGFPANRNAIAISAFQENAMVHEIVKEEHSPFVIFHLIFVTVPEIAQR
jgi:hypothetical protein